MNDILPVLLLMYALTCCIFLVLLRPPLSTRKSWLFAAAVAVFMLTAAAESAGALPTGNVFRRAVVEWREDGRVGMAARAAAIALGTLSALALVGNASNQRKLALAVTSLAAGQLTIGSILYQDRIGAYLPDPSATVSAGTLGANAAPGVTVTEIAVPIAPTALAYDPRGRVYVAGYSGAYLQNGVVLRLDDTENGFQATEVASGLTRPHGLAFRDTCLYVSRAGQFAHATDGTMLQERTGAITRLRDLNGDGVFDFYQDIVSDLPGAQSPDGLHQNNAITFSPAGKLYITVGVSTDHAPAVERHEGQILRCNADGSDLEPFAEGFRNPYGICVGPFGQIFCTDNDPNYSERGDELNLVLPGRHYGHPYESFAAITVEGTTAPLMRFSSAQGLSFVPDSARSAWSGCLLLAAYGDNAVSAVRVHRHNATYTCEPEFVAKIPGVVDVCYTTDGTAFACSYSENSVYKIVMPPSPSLHETPPR